MKLTKANYGKVQAAGVPLQKDSIRKICIWAYSTVRDWLVRTSAD